MGATMSVVGLSGERSSAACDISVQDRTDASFDVVEMNGYYRGVRLSEKGRRIADMLCTTPLKQTTRLGKRVLRWGDELAVILLASGEVGQFATAGR